MTSDQDAFMDKAEENLAAALSEFANDRFNSCANRCYYACYQAAISALLEAGIRPSSASGEWGHKYVHATFADRLVNRQKRYPSSISDTLRRTLALRITADYETESVSEVQAFRALRRTREFVEAIRARKGAVS